MRITNINQLLPLVEKKPEFILMNKGDYQVIDYVYQCADTFEYPELMECRGIKFDKDGLILARPFRKFFNYGENGADLPLHRPHLITEKMDGSMVHPILINGRWYLHTRKGHTDVAKKAERYVMSVSGDFWYGALCVSALNEGWTPIFEYVGPENRIVIRYPEERLVLLAMRHTITGEIMDKHMLHAWGKQHRVPVVRDYGPILTSKEEFVKSVRNLEQSEGYVVYFDDGYMVKIKADEYVSKHRALDDMSSKKKVVALCAQGFMDDVLPTLEKADQEELLDFNDQVQEIISEYVREAEWTALNWGGKRKMFAVHGVKYLTAPWIASVVFGIMDGKDPRKMVIDRVVKDPNLITAKWRGQ